MDQRGFGLTGQDVEKRSKGSAYGKTSWKDQMNDIAWSIEHARETFKNVPVFLMGHSMVFYYLSFSSGCSANALV